MNQTRETLPEYIRAFIAVFVIMVSFAIIFSAWYLRGINEAEGVAAIFSGSIGIVMGYYFGRTGVEKAQLSAEKAQQSADDAITGLQKANTELKMELEESREMESQLEMYKQYAKDYAKLVDEISKDPLMKKRFANL